MKRRCNFSSILLLGLVLMAVGFLSYSPLKGFFVNKQVESIKVYFPIKATMPDPANIENTGQWYLLDHVSSSLVHFNHIAGKFEPLMATLESYSSGAHSFTLNENAQFSDGTKITSADVVASIKRLLILKTSTHFPLWEYIEGCQNLHSMSDNCSGLMAVSDRRIDIRLKVQVQDFNLQLASPETGIWYHGDIDATSKYLEIKPTRYSGPYSIESISEHGFLLKRNSKNPISLSFPDSPRTIEIKSMKADQVPGAMQSGELDITIRSHNPYDDLDPRTFGYEQFSSAPSSLLYLHGAGPKPHHQITRRFIEQLWKNNSDTGIIAADNFLPFDPSMSLSRREFLEQIPEESSTQTVKIGIPWTYLSEGFYNFIRKSAADAGLNIELVPLTPPEWQQALMSKDQPKNIDYVLSIYAASERYPAVQLRYITGKVRGPSIDLKPAEQPDLSTEKKEILKDYQKALLFAQYAVPLFFSKHQMTYKKYLDVGDQPPSDAEVELWRVKLK